MGSKYTLGIDLGTSNCAATYAVDDLNNQLLGIEQVVSAGSVGESFLLPSSIYLAQEKEFKPEQLALSWKPEGGFDCVGQFAKEQGALVPDRLVHSAKSWLCHASQDPQSAILPWGSSIPAERKVSPFGASKAYLEHVRDAFLLKNDDLAELPNDLKAVITVPASFSEKARALTQSAAKEAGFKNAILLEEPQAAFYAWLEAQGDDWRKQVKPGDRILVCDIGGGTADFSLIAVQENEGNLELERISVGHHILLGGDNMDLALAHTLKNQLESDGKNIDEWQFQSLVHACRRGKEQLLEDDSLESFPIDIASRGSSLFGGSVSTKLTKDLVEQVILDGFFAQTDLSEDPEMPSATGLREMGLSYASDPVVTKHLAAFLKRSLSDDTEEMLVPTAVLFNGGVLKSEAVRSRILSVIQKWTGKRKKIPELLGNDLDLAVARGASYYASVVSEGKGVRVKAGAVNTYYIAVASSTLAIPGVAPKMKAICTLPKGTEEGSRLVLEGQQFALQTGQDVQFEFFSAPDRTSDALGSVVNDASDLDSSTVLSIKIPEENGIEGLIPVYLESYITELGMLEIWMHHCESKAKWKLEFKVRTD